jgi:adenine-specific DNA-methyltransferase
VNPDHAQALLAPYGGFESLVASFADSKFDPYISKYYSPKKTDTADFRQERLFYTAENGAALDRIRTGIEDLWPGWNLSIEAFLCKCLLLGPLLYEASTCSNTSGVFKAYHRGFGGYNHDALSRIMKPIEMKAPVLIGGTESSVFRIDAAELVKKGSFDLVYLDPPYNGHQYGSNYFMLNTIALWDKVAVDDARKSDGCYSKKAGIREDWTQTRSSYCYQKSALPAFRELMDNIDARHIVISYNSEGLMDLEELFDICGTNGKVRLLGSDYIKYRGGRQSLNRLKDNIEFALVVERGSEYAGTGKSDFRKFLALKRLGAYLRTGFNLTALADAYSCTDCRIVVDGFVLGMNQDATLSLISPLEPDDQSCLLLKKRLEPFEFADRGQAAVFFARQYQGAKKAALKRLIFMNLKKLAHRKYQREFSQTIQEISRLCPSLGTAPEMASLETIFRKRTAGKTVSLPVFHPISS